MIQIDASFVDSAAPNAAAIKNGRGLVAKGKLVRLFRSEDGTLLFGECKGSGKSTYQCSCDFVRPDQPTHRCTCPSRQFPCKHCLGLMYAFAEGRTFRVAPIPDDVAEKREKLAQRQEKREAAAEQPRKVNKSALAKKIRAQLEGLDLLERLTHDLVRTGMGNTNPKTARQITEQAKQLGDAFLPGAQAALDAYTRLFAEDAAQPEDDRGRRREAVYTEAFDQLTRLHSLVAQGRSYLQQRLEDPDLAPETGSGIAAWLGHAWQLRELAEAGLVEHDVDLVQLSFSSTDDPARREHVDTGVWMHLGSGRVMLTQTFRPYRAARFLKSDDSFFQVASVPELHVYPGDTNPRVRWEAMTPRPVEPPDLEAVRGHARGDFAALVKQVKQHLKTPLADKRPVHVLRYARIGETPGGETVVEDADGQRLVLRDQPLGGEPPTCHLLRLLPRELLADQALVARFHHDLETLELTVQPLAIVTGSSVVRLAY